jgi:hypothetical protein
MANKDAKKDELDHKHILEMATKHLLDLKGSKLEFIEIAKPPDVEYATQLALVVSKLSPIMGNMLEFDLVKRLNKFDWKGVGRWKRQDPGFPDALFVGNVTPTPGVEIKGWFPLATEMTARFRESVSHFKQDQTNVAVVAWIPEHIIYGKPKIIDVWVGSARSLAMARDLHYHNPPDYLVFEPEDTSTRTGNLQQTNTNGYKFQGNPEQLKKAEAVVASWGENGKEYSESGEYQTKLKGLLGRYPYRLDTNFAKIDRIEHAGLEKFKENVLNTKAESYTIKEWMERLFGDENTVKESLSALV